MAVALLLRKLELLTESVAVVADHSPPPAEVAALVVVDRTNAALFWKVTRDSVLVRVFRYAPPPRAAAADNPTAVAELFRSVELVRRTLAVVDETCKPPPCALKRPA
jgi:hypothetical protein